MADSAIEWTEKVWNPIVGCTVHSPGCTNCYAMRMAWRLQAMAAAGNEGLAHYVGTVTKTKAGPVWTGKIGIAPDSAFLAPLHRRTPTTYFVNSMADLFHKDVPDEVIDRVFAVMALTPQHTYQVLTKRSDRMREHLTHHLAGFRIRTEMQKLLPQPIIYMSWPLPNVWPGVSVEDQPRADLRIPDLLATPAAVRWISAEPLLGPVDLTRVKRFPVGTADKEFYNAIAGRVWTDQKGLPNPDPSWAYPGRPFSDEARGLDWIVAGGESGPGARGSTAEVEANMRSLLGQCRAAGVPFFGKQGFKKLPLPDDLMVKEYPRHG